RRIALVLETAELQSKQLTLGDLGEHVDELFLGQLIACDRPIELDPRLRILERAAIAGDRRTHHTPGNSVAGLVEPRSGRFGTRGMGPWNSASPRRRASGVRRLQK